MIELNIINTSAKKDCTNIQIFQVGEIQKLVVFVSIYVSIYA